MSEDKEAVSAKIEELKGLQEKVRQTYQLFDELGKLRKTVARLKEMGENSLLTVSAEFRSLRKMLELESDGTDTVIKPEGTIGGYIPPDELTSMGLDTRLEKIDAHAAYARGIFFDLSKIGPIGTPRDEEVTLLENTESKHYWIGVAQFLDRKIRKIKWELEKEREKEVAAEIDEEKREEWKKLEGLVTSVNEIKLPLEETDAERVHTAFCGGLLRGRAVSETTAALRERADAQTVAATVDYYRKHDPTKALELAKELKDRTLAIEIYNTDINIKRPFVKLVTAEGTKLARRLSQYDHSVEFSFDADLVVIVGNNGSGKSTLLKALAQFPDEGIKMTAPGRTRFSSKDQSLSFSLGGYGTYFKAEYVRIPEEEFSEQKEETRDIVVYRPNVDGELIPVYIDMTGKYWTRPMAQHSATKSMGQAQAQFVEELDNYSGWDLGYSLMFGERVPAAYLLDEIGGQLDPTASRTVGKALTEASKKRQIIIATHNPYIVQAVGRDSVIYSLNEVREGKPVPHKRSDLRKRDIEKLMAR